MFRQPHGGCHPGEVGRRHRWGSLPVDRRFIEGVRLMGLDGSVPLNGFNDFGRNVLCPLAPTITQHVLVVRGRRFRAACGRTTGMGSPVFGLVAFVDNTEPPQALWVLSGCLAVHSIWKDITSVPEQLWMGGVLLLAVGFEVGQALGLVPGVFDVWDLSMILIAYVAAQGISWSINRSQLAKEVCT